MKKRLLIIIAAFCISFTLMIVMSFFSLGRFGSYTSYSDQLSRTNNIIDNLYKTEVYLKDLDRAERGYLLTRERTYVSSVDRAVDDLRPAISELEKAIGSDYNQEQFKNLSLLKGDVSLRISFARQDIAHVDSAGPYPLSAPYYEGRQSMSKAVKKLREMYAIEKTLLSERIKNQKMYEQLTEKNLRYLLIIFCVITLTLFILIIKEIRSKTRFQEELQTKVIDLKRSHNELQEIAYAASHDLQEPLRKIQVFSNMLLVRTTIFDEESKTMLERINNSAERMKELIVDLTGLTSLSKIEEEKAPVDINRLLHYLLIDLGDKIEEKKAKIQVDNMPVIPGYNKQIKTLFHALLDNSLKFTREGVQPAINITYEIAYGDELYDLNPALADSKFHKITVADNGIGFENKFSNKMFQLFQRLHAQHSEYTGKGLGLAICQRVMANHEGYIIAKGAPQAGAKFKMFFPFEE
jgi:signal transduction histidine kinase